MAIKLVSTLDVEVVDNEETSLGRIIKQQRTFERVAINPLSTLKAV